MRRISKAGAGICAAALLVGLGLIVLQLAAEPRAANAGDPTAERPDDTTAKPLLDPAAWGGDHVGQSPPEYLTGDECLFCHRDVGPAWAENPHQLTIRPADPDAPALQALAGREATSELAAAVEYLLGEDRQVRYLQRSQAYGKLRMLTTAYRPAGQAGELAGPDNPQWDDDKFAKECAGCHTTAVDPATHAFSAISLDCYTCHGNVPLAHTKDTALVHLSGMNREAREVVSICGQCHLRGGKSRSTGLPYPNNFVAGDNLFRDFHVSWDESTIADMGPGERHVFQNARDVVLEGRTEVTCISCHDVHAQSAEKHQDLPRTALCNACHVVGQPASDFTSRSTHSAVCGY